MGADAYDQVEREGQTYTFDKIIMTLKIKVRCKICRLGVFVTDKKVKV